jgi:hypothetical protein
VEKSLYDIIEKLEARVSKLEEIVEKLTAENNRVRHNEFVGMEIRDFYCNGFFGREYDLDGAIIMSNTEDSLTVRTRGGIVRTAYFTDGWEEQMKEHVLEWCDEKEEDE